MRVGITVGGENQTSFGIYFLHRVRALVNRILLQFAHFTESLYFILVNQKVGIVNDTQFCHVGTRNPFTWFFLNLNKLLYVYN